MAEQGTTNPSNVGSTTNGPVPQATTKRPSRSSAPSLKAAIQHRLPLLETDGPYTTGWTKISRSSPPGPPESAEKNVSQKPFDTPPSVCCIERLQPELLETIFLNLVGLGEDDYAQNKTLVKILVLVCRRWSAIASRLALVTINISSPQSAESAIERAHWLSSTQGGWAPTRVLDISHHVEGSFYRFAELIELFGRTLYTLKLHGGRKKWNQPCAEGTFPPAIEGQVYFPMLQTLTIWEVASTTVQACIRNVDPTKLRDVGLSVAREGSPAEGYLSGQVFPRLETMKLGMLIFGGEAPWEDLKAATPALKSLRIAASNSTISDLVAHMRRNWPGMLKRLDVGVWDMTESVTHDHPAVREFAELAREKKLDHFELEVREAMMSWSLVSMRRNPDADSDDSE